MHPAQMLRVELNGRERILDVVCDLPGHVGPRRKPVGAFELDALTLQVGRHTVERFDQPPKLVRRCGDNPRIEIPARNASGGLHQLIDRVGDSLGHPIADAGAEDDEEHGGEHDLPIELVGLGFEFLLPERERYR